MEMFLKKLHSLPNLTLLSETKNIKASNKPFNDKLQKHYLDNDGKGADGINRFEITSHLNKYAKHGWTEDSYNDRKQWIEGKIKKLLRI